MTPAAGSVLRLADLLGREVLDATGASVGRVRDVRLRQDGPVLQPSGQPAFRVEGLIVGGGGVWQRFGYGHGEVRRPWLLAAIQRRRQRRTRWVDWQQLTGLTSDEITFTGHASDLRAPRRRSEQQANR